MMLYALKGILMELDVWLCMIVRDMIVREMIVRADMTQIILSASDLPKTY